MINYKVIDDVKIAVVSDCFISTTTDALNIMVEVYHNSCERIIIKKEMLPESFFSLKTGLSGEILQKFSTYRVKLAIVGDFAAVASKSLSAFIYESNKGRHVFFKKTVDEAAKALAGV